MSSPAPAPACGPPVLPGALSPLTADLVRGPRRTAVVLAASRAGVYLGVGDRVLPVLTSDAFALPGAVRLGQASGEVRLGARPGDIAVVGAGSIRLPAVVVRGVRTWRPARVPATCAAKRGDLGEVRAALRSPLADGDGWLAAGVTRAVRDADPREAVSALVGRGPGLTPSGDDALAGALLVRRCLGRAPRAGERDPLLDAVRARAWATTAVSAALLQAAADGFATGEVVDLVTAVGRGDAARTRTALPAVLAIGHTSGRDLVTGVSAALQALTSSERVAA